MSKSPRHKLAGHLERRYGCPINPHSLCRRMKAMGLSWKRPRYVVSQKAPHQPQKKERLSVGLQLAARLGIHLLWLPMQWSELNAMDHLWRGLEQHVASNRQYPTVDAQAQDAEDWVLGLSPRQALRKAGVLSRRFWLRSFL